MVTATPQDLSSMADNIQRFDIENFVMHDQCGYRITSRHNLGILALHCLLEKCRHVIGLEYVTESNMHDRLFYSFDIRKDTHQFVINSKVHRQLLTDRDAEMRSAAQCLLNAIAQLPLDDENARSRNEYVERVNRL